MSLPAALSPLQIAHEILTASRWVQGMPVEQPLRRYRIDQVGI